ncbi:MAG: hypothetical protein U5K51_01955 [Flavobacteriaceae bacterium]|nr:hypothetical protein [Flavobacteriaceae bacterium]
MKPNIIYSLFFLFLLINIPNCQSQLLKKLKTAVNQAAAQGLQKKSNQELDSVTEEDQESKNRLKIK